MLDDHSTSVCDKCKEKDSCKDAYRSSICHNELPADLGLSSTPEEIDADIGRVLEDPFGANALLDSLEGLDPTTRAELFEQKQAALAELISDPERLLAMPTDELEELLINICCDGSAEEKAALRQRSLGVTLMQNLQAGEEPDPDALAELIETTIAGQTKPIPE